MPLNDLRPSRREIRMLRKSFLESTKLLGRVCVLIPPSNRTLDKYTNTDTYTYENSPEYPYLIHLQSEPRKKTLELFGFSKESTDTKPLIADCPMYRYPVVTDTNLLDVSGVKVTPAALSEGCLIKIEMYNLTDETSELQTYEIEKVLASDDGVHYLINLVPYRSLETGVEAENQPDSGSSFIRQSDE
jgi:hypothetical protein